MRGESVISQQTNIAVEAITMGGTLAPREQAALSSTSVTNAVSNEGPLRFAGTGNRPESFLAPGCPNGSIELQQS